MEKKGGKIKQDRVMTAVVGSYPKPRYIFPGSGRKLLDKFGMTFYELEDDYEFTRKYAKGIAKIGLPGPSTVVDCVADKYYKGNLEQMAMDYAQAIRYEVENLLEAGCQVIQFDDKEQLIFAPDCGMLQLSRTAARRKLANLAAAASILNGSQ